VPKKNGEKKTKRDKIDVIIPKLSTALSEEKKNKVTNYLSALRIEGKIVNTPGYFWEIV
jgi:ATP-dependent DNA helicase RecG